MAYASGGNAYFAYGIENDAWGTKATGTWYKIRHTGETLKGSTQFLQSNELRGDRMKGRPSRGAIDVTGPFNFEFSWGSFDDLIQLALFSAWDDSTKAISASTGISFDATTHQIRIANGSTPSFYSFATDDLIKVTGSTNATNNSYFSIVSMSAGKMTVSVDSSWSDVETVSAGDAITLRCSEIKNGSTAKYVSIEKWFSDISVSLQFLGCMVNQFSLNFQENAMVTGSINFTGREQTSGTSAATTYTDKSTTAPFETSEADMVIKEGGTAVALVRNFSLQLTNNLRGNFGIGSGNKKSFIAPGNIDLTGTLEAFFQDATMLNKWLNRTPSSMDMLIPSATKGNGCYRIYIPGLDYSGDTPTIANDQEIPLTMPWAAYYDSTTTKEIIIQR